MDSAVVPFKLNIDVTNIQKKAFKSMPNNFDEFSSYQYKNWLFTYSYDQFYKDKSNSGIYIDSAFQKGIYMVYLTSEDEYGDSYTAYSVNKESLEEFCKDFNIQQNISQNGIVYG